MASSPIMGGTELPPAWSWQRISVCAWSVFCENEHKPGWRLLDRSGKVLDKNIASPGAKIECHNISACLEVLRVLQEQA